jgi:two-component system response regulator DctR
MEPQSRAPGRWRVLIAEDDAGVAELHRRVVDGHSAFSVAATCGDFEETAQAIEEYEPDLVILDLAMPRGDGVSLLRKARADSVPVDVIVVSASRDATTIRSCMQLGAVEYLVKPFMPQRLHDALVSFARRDRALNRSELAQEDVDALRLSGATLRQLPRGLKRATLRRIWTQLKTAGEPLTAAQVGDRVGVARVTARRYLDYLEAVSLAELVRVPQPVGRPSNRYRVARRAGQAPV